MSDEAKLDEVKKELQQAKISLAQLNARLAANEQVGNGILKDLLDTKTNLNLYMSSHQELSINLDQLKKSSEATIKDLTDKNQALTKELEALKAASVPSECTDSACEAA